MLKEKSTSKFYQWERISFSAMRDYSKRKQFACTRQPVGGTPPAPSFASNNLPDAAEL
jgi:hypothetical protein